MKINQSSMHIHQAIIALLHAYAVASMLRANNKIDRDLIIPWLKLADNNIEGARCELEDEG